MEKLKKSFHHLIIGANSFLSRTITIKLLESNLSVEGVYNRNTDKLIEGVKYYKTNELKTLKDVYDSVFIISAFIPEHICNDTNEKLYETNVAVTERIVRQFPSAKIVLASSVSVYGNQDKIMDEFSPSLIPGAYGLSKLWAEQVVRNAGSFAIVRISSMYGKGMKLSTFLPKVINQAIQQNKITLWGEGCRRQNYISVVSVADYMIAASTSDINSTFLAVNSQSFSNKEIAEIVADIYRSEIIFSGEDNSTSFYYNNQYTLNKLGVIKHKSIKKDIEDLIKWIKKMS